MIKRHRKYWGWLHLWLGLTLGVWLSLIGLTGALLVFYQEIEEIIHPGIFSIPAHPSGEAAFRPMEEIVAAMEDGIPSGVHIGSAYYPHTNGSAWWARYTIPDNDSEAALWYVFVDPYTAQVVGRWQVKGQGDWFRREFSGFLYDLHYKLLLPGEIGTPLVGIIDLLCLAALAIGICLWWPKNGNWQRALKLKDGASSHRRIFELHNLTGVYFLPVLAVVLFTGLYFNLHDQFMWCVQLLSPTTMDSRNVKSVVPPSGTQPIGLSRAFAIARENYPEGRPKLLRNALSFDGPYSICSKSVASVSYFADDRCVLVDQYSGEVLWVTASGNHSAGDTFLAWQLPLHSGKAFGLPGRILVLLSGLALPLLFVTGVIRWLQKRRARAKQAARLAARTP